MVADSIQQAQRRFGGIQRIHIGELLKDVLHVGEPRSASVLLFELLRGHMRQPRQFRHIAPPLREQQVQNVGKGAVVAVDHIRQYRRLLFQQAPHQVLACLLGLEQVGPHEVVPEVQLELVLGDAESRKQAELLR